MGLGNDHGRQARQFLASAMGQDTEEPPGAGHQVEGVGDPSPLRARAAFHQGNNHSTGDLGPAFRGSTACRRNGWPCKQPMSAPWDSSWKYSSFHAWQWWNPCARGKGAGLLLTLQDQGRALWVRKNGLWRCHNLPVVSVTSETIFVQKTMITMTTFWILTLTNSLELTWQMKIASCSLP